MKRAIIITALVATGCGAVSSDDNIDIQNEVMLDYSIAENDMIHWSDVFLKEEERYLVYFYSEYCGYCKILKQDFLSYYLLNKEKIYLVNAIEENAVFNSPAIEMIGIDNIDDFYIAGTPILVEFINHTVTNLYAGLDNIKMYIGSEQ